MYDRVKKDIVAVIFEEKRTLGVCNASLYNLNPFKVMHSFIEVQ